MQLTNDRRTHKSLYLFKNLQIYFFEGTIDALYRLGTALEILAIKI